MAKAPAIMNRLRFPKHTRLFHATVSTHSIPSSPLPQPRGPPSKSSPTLASSPSPSYSPRVGWICPCPVLSSVSLTHLLACHERSDDLRAPRGRGLRLPHPYVSDNCPADDKYLMNTFKSVKEGGRKEEKKERKRPDFPGPVLSSR